MEKPRANRVDDPARFEMTDGHEVAINDSCEQRQGALRRCFRYAESILRPLGLDSTGWRSWMCGATSISRCVEEARSGRLPYTKLDVLHRRTLEQMFPRFGLNALRDAELSRLTFAWHRLDAWKNKVDFVAQSTVDLAVKLGS